MIHVLHALLGSSLAEFKDCKVTAWALSQNPQAAQDIVAKEMGIPKEDVVCHVTLLSGGFGRKSKPDYVAEAAVLSKKVGRPVKVFWTREDNLKFELLQRCGGHVQESGPGSQREADRLATTVDFSAHSFIFDVNAVYVIPAILMRPFAHSQTRRQDQLIGSRLTSGNVTDSRAGSLWQRE